MKKYKVYVRNLTKDVDCSITLPTDRLDEKLEKGCEYIIIDSDLPFQLSEFTDISQVNSLLKKLEEVGMSEGEFQAIGKSFFFSEMFDAYNRDDDPFVAIHLDNDAFPDNEYLGRTLYSEDISYLPFKVPEEAEDYIKWEQNWYSAESDGWRCSSDAAGDKYLVKMVA